MTVRALPFEILTRRAGSWFRLLGLFAASTLTVQAAGLLAGILWTRNMSIEEYALFSICLSTVALASVLSDMGLLASITYFWRRTLGNAAERASYIVAVWQLRRQLLVGVSIFVVLAMAIVLKRQGIDIPRTMAAIALIVIITWVQLNGSFVSTLMRLRGAISETLIADVAGALARLVGAALATILMMGSAVFGLAVVALGTAISYAIMAAREPRVASPLPTSSQTRRELLAYVGPTIPSVLLYAFKDQVVSLVAWFIGGSAPVAEMFALGRLAIIFSVFGGFIAAVVVPRLAQFSDDRKFLRAAFLVALMLVTINAALVTLAAVAPGFLLLVIGKNYEHLHTELVWSLIGASITTTAVYLAQLNRLRGWVGWEPAVACLYFLMISVVIARGDFSTSLGALMANLYLAVFGLLAMFATLCAGLLGMESVRVRA